MKFIVPIFALILIFSACQTKDKKQEKNENNIDTLTYAYDSVKVYSKNPPIKRDSISDTTYSSIVFPVFKNDSLNQYIKRQVFNFFAQEEPVTSYQAIADSFIRGYDSFVNDNPDRPQAWYLAINIDVLKQYKDYISLRYAHSDYAGGAHGNTSVSFLNYNPRTNTIITLDSLIQKGKMQELTKLAETIFRKDEKLSANESLEGKYFFGNGKFALAQSFHVNDKGLVFLYNPYEIKAYVEGYTELVIPYSALKHLAKPNSILSIQH
ncbi:MAG: DUF3298 domain-containing protein [Pedobacter sp.]|nr:MAG: DUF3298 domain-containing protein [Pedobacter sp.]